MTCGMLTGMPDGVTPSVECGKPASYVYTKDRRHGCCAECFASMGDDPDIQEEYEWIAKVQDR